MVLGAILQDNGAHSLTVLAGRLGLPLSTAHRIVQSLERSGYLARSRRGYYHAGPAFSGITPFLGTAARAAAIARPLLKQLAMKENCHAHLGIFEQDMVTYLVKEGQNADPLFTRQHMQLEAYCSGLGKVLLAGLDDAALASYLSNGPFIALTAGTIIEPDALLAEIMRVRAQGFAVDNGEISENLFCLAVPLPDSEGKIIAAISASYPLPVILERGWERSLSYLRRIAAKIEEAGSL